MNEIIKLIEGREAEFEIAWDSCKQVGCKVIFSYDSISYTVPVKNLDTPTHSRVFLYFDYFIHCIIIVKTSNYEITHMESCRSQISVKQIKIFVLIFDSSKQPPFALMTALHTLGILSTSFTRNAFPTVLKEFPRMLSTYWLLFLHGSTHPKPSQLGDYGGQVI